MQIIINHSAYNNSDHYERIWGIVDFINALQQGMFTDDELDKFFPKAQEVYFVDYFNCEFENGGFHQYFINSAFNKDMNAAIMQGLENMKSYKHMEIFKEAFNTVESMLPADREVYLSPVAMLYKKERVFKNAAVKKVHDHVNALADRMFEVLLKDPLQPICYKYIESFDNLSVVSDDQYDVELGKILALVPHYEERKKAADASWQENQPDYFRIATILCKKYGIKLKTINALDFGEDMVAPEIVQQNYEKQRWHYHISTDKGYMYIINDGGIATFYNGDTHEVVGSMKIQIQEESK